MENNLCKDITVNDKYNLESQPIIYPKRRKQRKINENDSTDTKMFNFNNFNIISTLFPSIKLVVYSCSHMQPFDKITHSSTKIIVTVPENCLIMYNYVLYHE